MHARSDAQNCSGGREFVALILEQPVIVKTLTILSWPAGAPLQAPARVQCLRTACAPAPNTP